MAPINLQTLVADTMAQHPDASRDELEAALINGVETTVGRRLTEYEKAKIGVELGVQWNAREQANAPPTRTLAELRNVRMGDMTKEEARLVVRAATDKLAAELSANREAITEILSDNARAVGMAVVA